MTTAKPRSVRSILCCYHEKTAVRSTGTVTRLINKAAVSTGLGHIHPHQLRHALAAQAVNRGMSLEAIAALLGHHSLDMTLRSAEIANRTVGEEYFAVTNKVEALYGQHTSLPADAAGPKMTKLRREHYRMLGNGYCARSSRSSSPDRPMNNSEPMGRRLSRSAAGIDSMASIADPPATRSPCIRVPPCMAPIVGPRHRS
jgi:hypothetical protein